MSTSTQATKPQRRRGHHGAKVGHHHKRTANQVHPLNIAGFAEGQPATEHMRHITTSNTSSLHANATRAMAPAAAAAVAAHKRGHHGHGGHHHHAQAPLSGVTSPVARQNATAGVVSKVTMHPPGAALGAPVIYSPPPPISHGGGLSGGAIFGLVICILAVFGVAGFVVYRVWKKRNHVDPMFTMAPGNRGGYWGRRDSHSHIVSPPPDDDMTSFDQDFKHWVEVVGSASGKPYPANNSSTKYYNNSNSSGSSNSKRPALNRIPSGVEPVGSTENGTLVFQEAATIKVTRINSETGSMVNEPVSPLAAPPGFAPFGGPIMRLDPPPHPPSGVRAPPFQH